MLNNVKKKLDEGKNVLGTFFELGSEEVVESLGYTGLDFVIVDTEHGPYSVESTMNFLRTSELVGLTAFVRVSDVSRPSILRNLDIGASGLVVPCIETVAEVKQLVEWSKYPPLGSRGYFTGRRTGYGNRKFSKDIITYFETCNKESLLIPQCETMSCLENIFEITSLDGVDGIFVGPFDLSIALGIPSEFDNPKFKLALDKILNACIQNNKYCFIFAGSIDKSNDYFKQGFNGVALGTDTAILIDSYRSIVAEVRK